MNTYMIIHLKLRRRLEVLKPGTATLGQANVNECNEDVSIGCCDVICSRCSMI